MNDPNSYNQEQVYYCADCLSLAIITTDFGLDCCNKCGSTEIRTASITEWESLYLKRYGTPYIKHHEKSH